MISDGCTGFQWAEWFFDIRQCCVVHDMGGSDGTLFDCLLNHVPWWAGLGVAVAMPVMYAGRPFVRAWRRRKKVK